jgi:hypothetical protein
MYGNSIGLGGFPEVGPYELVFEITETGSGASIERSLTIEITE